MPSGPSAARGALASRPNLREGLCALLVQNARRRARRYSCWIADALWALHQVHPDREFAVGLLEGLEKNYEGWESEHFDPDVGLFRQTGHDDGMEFNINSRQTTDILRGAPGFRPTLNSYLWADALAIAHIAELAGKPLIAEKFKRKAASIKQALQEKLWDPKRQFFFHMAARDESKDGFMVKKGSLTYQTGQFMGDSHGREEMGFTPWQFNLPDAGYEFAWSLLMKPNGFLADFGPTVVERHDPLFLITKSCCFWSGQSWPYATAQTLKAAANLLQNYKQEVFTKVEYVKLLEIYARTHRKDGKPYIAEGVNPDTGSWEGYDSYNHSEHYFHSGFCDLVISGLVGLVPRSDDTLEINPLASDDWDYFALDNIAYHGCNIGVYWDKSGERYGLGKGLRLLVDGKLAASSDRLDKLSAKLPSGGSTIATSPAFANFAVNNDGGYFPRARASFVATDAQTGKAIDGNYWYHKSPPNRWTCEGSPNASDWFEVDFGVKRKLETIKVYLLDDGESIVPPAKVSLEYGNGSSWIELKDLGPHASRWTGRKASVIPVRGLETSKLRVTFTHAALGKTGLTEIEAWGPKDQPLEPPETPEGNLAYNSGGRAYPKLSASFTSHSTRSTGRTTARWAFCQTRTTAGLRTSRQTRPIGSRSILERRRKSAGLSSRSMTTAAACRRQRATLSRPGQVPPGKALPSFRASLRNPPAAISTRSDSSPWTQPS